MPALWIGSNNQKKLAELTRLLTPLGVELRTPEGTTSSKRMKDA